jgi:hypothetical protein
MAINGYVLTAALREQLARARTDTERARIRTAVENGTPLYEMTDMERRLAHANYRLTVEYGLAHSLGG